MKTPTTSLLSVLFLALAACGGPLDEPADLTPVYEIPFDVRSVADAENPFLALGWVRLIGETDLRVVQVQPLHAAVDLKVRSLPPSDMLNQSVLDDGTVTSVGIATLFVFDDVDGDAAFDIEVDRVVASSRDRVVVWVDETAPVAESLFVEPEAVAPGFQLAQNHIGPDRPIRLQVLDPMQTMTVSSTDNAHLFSASTLGRPQGGVTPRQR